MTKSDAYSYGHDCGPGGPTTANCDFRIFATPELLKEWERGKRDGVNYRKLIEEKACGGVK